MMSSVSSKGRSSCGPPSSRSVTSRRIAKGCHRFGSRTRRSSNGGHHLYRGVITMRIAQVAPLYESVPPKLYGGTERVVSYLTEELVRLGHEVTLFATGDSQTAAKLVAPCKRALRLD